MGSLQPLIEKFSGSFLIAGLIPALAFVTAGMYVFEPIMPSDLVKWLGGTFNPLNQSGLFMLILTIVIGYFLTSLNTFLLKLFEGYILIWRVPVFRQAELRRYYQYKRKMKQLERKISIIEKRKRKKDKKILKSLRDKEKSLQTEFQINFPPRKNEVLPTRFGNILKAAEAYSMTHYHIDAVPMWTRLIYVIDPNYDQKIEQSHNQLSFLVNSAVLSALFSLSCFLAAIYQWIQQLPLGNRYLGLCVFGIAITVIFNRASILSVSEFGDMIRSAIDLFRFDLLKQLHIPLPEDSESELDIWGKQSRLINYGYVLENKYPISPITYQHDGKPSSGAGPEVGE